MVAESQRPRNPSGFHWLHDVVDSLLDLGSGLGITVDDVAVDEREARLLGIQDLLHQFKGAPVGTRAILGVVELNDLELAICREFQFWPRSRSRLLSRCCGRGRTVGCEQPGNRGGGATNQYSTTGTEEELLTQTPFTFIR